MGFLANRLKKPTWAKYAGTRKVVENNPKGPKIRKIPVYEVTPGVVYPLYLSKLNVDHPDQYWLEVARRCFTEDLNAKVGQCVLRILADPEWRLDKYSAGLGAAEGAQQFRIHYNKL